jgi:hypothetical protein
MVIIPLPLPLPSGNLTVCEPETAMKHRKIIFFVAMASNSQTVRLLEAKFPKFPFITIEIFIIPMIIYEHNH